MECLNRKPNARGVAHGGVAVISRTATCSLKRMELHNPDGYEVLVTSSSLVGHTRKLIMITCYLPPNYNVHRAKGALEHIENVVRETKRTHKDPFIVVGGDFNQWDIGDALADFPDLKEADVGPTRKDKH